MKTLRTKILLGYGASLVIVAVILALAIVLLLRLGRASDAILQENYRSILAAEKMINDIERQDSGVLLILLKFQDLGLKEFRDSEVSFLQWLGRAKDNITEPGEKELVEAIEQNYRQYLHEFSQMRLIVTTDQDQAVTFYHDQILPRFRIVRDTCIKLQSLNHEAMYASSNRARRLAAQAIPLISLIGVAAIIVGISFSLFLSRLISRPITELTSAVSHLAQGDYAVQVSARGSGELALLAESFNGMAEKLKHFHEMNIDQILAEKRKSEAIIRSVDDGLVVVDEKLLITNINPKASTIFDVAAEDGLGKHILEVVRNDHIFQALKMSLESGAPPGLAEGEDILTVPLGEETQHYQIAILPMRSRAGVIPGAVLVLRDVTRLKEIDRLKSEFVMTASHELRTPLTSIGMSVAMLMETASAKLTDTERELLDVCHDEVNRLKALVNDLLDLSKIEAGKLELFLEPVSPSFISQQAVAMVRNQTEAKGIVLTVAVSADVPEVVADPNKIVWVVVNLLANAVRYTPAQSHIRLSAEGLGDKVKFSVQDDGPGVPREMQSRIFDKFVRLDQGEETGGSGLGLAISKEIIRAHRGVIWLESEPGQGSTFSFTLPMAAGAQEV
jgi:two-component system, NtrC family, sensor histidine kinase KinB